MGDIHRKDQATDRSLELSAPPHATDRGEEVETELIHHAYVTNPLQKSLKYGVQRASR